MTMKSTNSIREKLEEYSLRINRKIQALTLERKLPYERLSNGIQLKDLVVLTIKYLDDGNEKLFKECILELNKKGIKV